MANEESIWVVRDNGVDAVLERHEFDENGVYISGSAGPISFGFTGGDFTAIKAHRANRNLVYIGHVGLGVDIELYRYNGSTISVVSDLGPRAYDGLGINSIWLEDADEDSVWYTVGDYKATGIHTWPLTGRVYRATDGLTFAETAGQPTITNDSDFPHLADIIVNETSPRTIVAIHNWAANPSSVASESTDDGATWAYIGSYVPLGQREFVQGNVFPYGQYGQAGAKIRVFNQQLASAGYGVFDPETGIDTAPAGGDRDGGYGGYFASGGTHAIIFAAFTGGADAGEASYTTDNWATGSSKTWSGAFLAVGKGSFSLHSVKPWGIAVTTSGVVRISLDRGVTWSQQTALTVGNNVKAMSWLGLPEPNPPVITDLLSCEKTTLRDVAIVGTGIVAATITIKNNGVSVGTATVTATGVWYAVVTFAYGTHTITATQTVSGAESDPSNTITLIVRQSGNTTAPSTTLSRKAAMLHDLLAHSAQLVTFFPLNERVASAAPAALALALGTQLIAAGYVEYAALVVSMIAGTTTQNDDFLRRMTMLLDPTTYVKNVLDRSPQKLTGTVAGIPLFNTRLNGDFNGIITDGSTAYFSIGDVTALEFARTDQFSGFVVVRWDGEGQIAGKGAHGAQGWEWYVDSSGIVQLILTNVITTNQLRVQSSTPLVAGTVYCLGFTYNGNSGGSGVTLYRNGVVDAQTVPVSTLTGAIVSQSAALIGRSTSGNCTALTLSMLALWKRLVPAEEMRRYAFVGGFF